MTDSAADDLGSGIAQNKPDLVSDALINGADANQRWEWASPLHLAVIVSSPPIVQLLINAGAEINARDRMRRTALHYAAQGLTINREHSRELIGLLLTAGATIDTKDEMGRTPLDYAILMENREAEAALVAAGAKRNRRFESWLARTDDSSGRPQRGLD